MSCDPLAFRGVVREPPLRQGRASAGSHETTGDPAGVKWLSAHSTLRRKHFFIHHGAKYLFSMDVYPEKRNAEGARSSATGIRRVGKKVAF